MTLLQSSQPSTSPIILGCQDIYMYIFFHVDRFPLLKTITGSHYSQGQYSLECPASLYTSPSHLGTVQQCCLPGDPCLSLNTSFCFHLLTLLTLFSHCTNSFHPLFSMLLFQLAPFNTWFTETCLMSP